jgi:predicted secreted protein
MLQELKVKQLLKRKALLKNSLLVLSVIFPCTFSCVYASSVNSAGAYESHQENNVVKVMHVEVDHRSSLVTFELKANLSTGANWFLAPYDESILHLVRSDYVRDTGGKIMAGAPGKIVYVFAVNSHLKDSEKEVDLDFTYKRSFEAAVIDRVKVIVHL